jgi:glutathione S-transferase
MVKSQEAETNRNESPATQDPKLYVIPGSHPCRAAMLMLDHKGVPHRVIELPVGAHMLAVRLLRFPGRTVPALVWDGRRVQTSRRIARFLDELDPDRPLVPRDRREEIEDAERLADEVLQPLARRLVLAAGRRGLASVANHGDDGRLGPILAYSRDRRARIVRFASRHFGVTDETEALDLAALPAVLDRVDALIAAKVINGEQLNAADFQIAPSLCLLAYRLDLQEAVEARPAWCLADRVIPAAAEVA